jgi:predicted nuclease of predicted toxin-antitoxin system
VKLLFDQNISHRVVIGLGNIYPKAKQVKELELENASDHRIWAYAKENSYTIVTFDSDFNDLATLYGHPPKVIWLRFGNTLTSNLIKLLEFHFDVISSFINDPAYKEIACLEIT